MTIYTNSPKVRRNRKHTVEMILSQHDAQCATCVRSGNCTLQSANFFENFLSHNIFAFDNHFSMLLDLTVRWFLYQRLLVLLFYITLEVLVSVRSLLLFWLVLLLVSSQRHLENSVIRFLERQMKI